ncbi:MAG: cytochrome b/b6 domain-containing protein [bacterium]
MNRLCRIFSISLLALGASWSGARALDNSDCFTCHDDKTLAAAFGASVHRSNQCTSCHTDIREAPHPDGFKAGPATCSPCHEKDIATYLASAHGIAAASGSKKAARCTNCHGSHAIVPIRSATSPLNHENQAATCGKCHAQVLQEVRESIHGKAMAEGLRDAPTCTDCHADHQIETLKTASPMKIAEQVCSRCHASERLNTRYNLPSNRSSSFFDSYHGLAARLGSTRAANCASCHGFHKILPSSDPLSMVHPSNMVKTCKKCHPGANENFSLGKVHMDNTPSRDIGSIANRWVRWIYLTLIAGVIGGMLIHNLLTFRRKLIHIYGKRDRSIIRMNLTQRIQHGLLLVSFISLAVTGFALKYPDGWMAYLVGGSETFRRMGHRAAAVVMLAVALAHVAYLLFTRDGRKLFKDFLPAKNDFTDVFANLKYLIMPHAPKPKFPRFGYGEKAEYWAVVWGTILMGITGIMIWFKMDMTHWMPRWVIEVATTIHFYEAILAVLAIIVWHFYAVFLDPDIYPNNTAWLDGKVSREWYEDEHGLDVETLGKTEASETDTKEKHEH